MVDMGIILCENILKHLDEANPDESRLEVVHRASSEVGSAVLTAVATTIVSFLPVFTMIGAEGKLFKPLAFTKTFALAASVLVALTIIPPVAHVLFTAKITSRRLKQVLYAGLVVAGLGIGLCLAWWAGLIVSALGTYKLVEETLPDRQRAWKERLRYSSTILASGAAVLFVGILLTDDWLPLGPEKGFLRNFAFVAILIGGLLAFFQLFQKYLYRPLLWWCLNHKLLFLCAPTMVLVLGFGVWLGPRFVFGRIPQEYDAQSLSEADVAELSGFERFKYELGGLRGRSWDDIRQQPLATKLKWTLATTWKGFGKEFMPPLDEGSYLYMPTTMPHASIGESLDVLQLQNQRITAIPEVELAVGKIGRVQSPLDPAPISMIETVINYKSQYIVDKDGHRLKFRYEETRLTGSRTRKATCSPRATDSRTRYRAFCPGRRRQVGARSTRRPPMAAALDPKLNPPPGLSWHHDT